MDATLTERIRQIHDSPIKLMFEFAGAGSGALFWLHAVPGSSRTMLEAIDRYAPASLATLLGGEPATYVARATAEAMAETAYRRATQLSDAAPVIGVAVTAAIATDRVKRGKHGCWVSVCGRTGLHSYSLTLIKGARERSGEEAIVSQLVISAIAEACGIEALTLSLREGERVEQFKTTRADPVALLLDGSAQSVVVAPSGERDPDAPVQGGLLSGSFNPLHQGHERLVQAATKWLGQPVAFELPVVNADKPPLGYAEIERRLTQFQYRFPVVLSRAPLFVQKAALFPGCTFVVGYDTAVRIIEPRYYGGVVGRDTALAEIAEHGCRFLVAGRLDGDGQFMIWGDMPLPPAFTALFLQLSEEEFRVDLSSTTIRALQL